MAHPINYHTSIVNLSFLLPHQLTITLPQVQLRFPNQRLVPILLDEEDMVFAFPFRVMQTDAGTLIEFTVVELGRFSTTILESNTRSRQTPGEAPANSWDFLVTFDDGLTRDIFYGPNAG